MKVAQEFVKFDDEDRGNVDYEGGEFPYGIHKGEKDHMIFLCYYTPEHQPEFATRKYSGSRQKFGKQTNFSMALQVTQYYFFNLLNSSLSPWKKKNSSGIELLWMKGTNLDDGQISCFNFLSWYLIAKRESYCTSLILCQLLPFSCWEAGECSTTEETQKEISHKKGN